MTSFASLPYELPSQIWKQALLTGILSPGQMEEDLVKLKDMRNDEFYVTTIGLWEGTNEELLSLHLLKTRASNGSLAAEAQELFVSYVQTFFKGPGLLRFLEAKYSPGRFLTRIGVQLYHDDILNMQLVRKLNERLATLKLKEIWINIFRRGKNSVGDESISVRDFKTILHNLMRIAKPWRYLGEDMYDVAINGQVSCGSEKVLVEFHVFETFERCHRCWTECAKKMSNSGRCEAHGTKVLVEDEELEQA